MIGEEYGKMKNKSEEIGMDIPELNDICWKFNSDNHLSYFENTYHDTFAFEQELGDKWANGEDIFDSRISINLKYADSVSEYENKPTSEWHNNTPQPNLAQLLDMPINEQRNKGLEGTNFKIIKVVHPDTQRARTKFVCIYNNWGKVWENKWAFLDHHRCHTGSKPYECKMWKKKFTQRGNLRQHLMTHKNN